jgi:hypothetical protein
MAALIDKPDLSPPPAPLNKTDGELHRRLVDHLETLKRPSDLLRVTQVSPHHFRVNTLALHADADSVLQTFRIIKSQFLHVEDRHGELVITDQTRR